VAAAAALTAVLLPALAGQASATTYTGNTVPVGLTSKLMTIYAPVTASSADTLTGSVTLGRGVTYSWTYGFFNAAPPGWYSSTTMQTAKLHVPEGPIWASEITPRGGSYSWACGLYPDTTHQTYTSSCNLTSADDEFVINIASFTVPTPSFLVDWQMSFVPTSRVSDKGKTGASNPANDDTQCTWAAARQIYDHYGFFPPKWGNGDALYWFTGANNSGWSTSLSPQSDSVVVFKAGVDEAGSIGHVAWVRGIEFRTNGHIYLHTTEMNIGGQTGYLHRILEDGGAKTTNPPPDMGYILPAN
jgi:surface antigen